MLVVISNPAAVPHEITIIRALFDAGLEILHIRKPAITAAESGELIEKIPSKYHHRVALHQHHEVAGDYGIRRLHFTEIKRMEMTEESLMQLKARNYILSSSIHAVTDYKNVPASFDYTFFGPVFNSISKKGYTSAVNDGFIFPAHVNQPKVIAIGGIDATNIRKAGNMKFDGAAVLGAIWQKPRESVEQFKKLQKAWNQTGR
ncbi:MAG: thiamine phosphate synthase [Chitinophagaceae bacterium]